MMEDFQAVEVGTGVTTAEPSPPSFAEATRFWAKLGFISFGGPAGQIAIMHRELVERRRWLDEERFLHALNYCMLLPGPEAHQLAIYTGWLLHGTRGGLVAGACFVLPAIVLLLGLSYAYAVYGDVRAVSGILSGFKPVVLALVVFAVLRIGRRALRRRAHMAIAIVAFVAVYLLHVPFPLIVAAAGATGLAGAARWPDVFGAARGHEPTGLLARPSRGRTIRVLGLGAALWIAPQVGLVLWRGWDSLHAQLYRFFTQAALVTFGGAYAVLAYVTHAVTVGEGWITAAQAVDGMALAETTPGPLIMVLQFIGFMSAWSHPEGMPRALSAVLGGLVTSYVTFLPSFIFIFAGAPYIEALRGQHRFSDALNGVTAAVVGVIFGLGLIFGQAVLWPEGMVGPPSWFAVVASAAAFGVLTRTRVDAVLVVLAGGLAGLAWVSL